MEDCYINVILLKGNYLYSDRNMMVLIGIFKNIIINNITKKTSGLLNEIYLFSLNFIVLYLLLKLFNKTFKNLYLYDTFNNKIFIHIYKNLYILSIYEEHFLLKILLGIKLQ